MSSSSQKHGSTIAPGPAFARLNGVWRTHAYGNLLVIGPEGYQLYQETRVSCLLAYEGTLEELAKFYVDLRISPAGRSFSARRATGVTRVRYRRLTRLPDSCSFGGDPWSHDPVFNFEVFWHTFHERYALFELRGVDWRASWDKFRPRIDHKTGAKRLFATFVEMLEPLRDGHVRLRAPVGHFEAVDISSLEQRVLTPEERRRGTEAAPVIAQLRERLRDTVREHYLEGKSRRSGHGMMEWGRLDSRTGYLAIRGMAGLSGRLDHPREDQQVAAAAMGKVLRDLGDLPTLVLDLRENGGGYDGVALRIAGFLTDRKRLAFIKSPSKGEGYSSRQRVYVEPRGQARYRGRIVLLTSGLTASAAEILVLALLRRPRLTRLGEATLGILSDVMERHLPNGWTLSLSNELYRASDGALYEDRGIPPHIEIPFLDRSGLRAGRDRILDQVLRG